MGKNAVKIPINPSYYEFKSEYAEKWEESRSERYKEYRKKWAENPRHFIVEDAPLHLDIEPTNACNLKCPMCPRTLLAQESGENTGLKVGSMDIEFYKQLIDQAVEIGVYSIKLNWLGEPLVHKDIVEMVRYAKEKGIVDVMFNTNAVLLTEKMVREFIEAGLDKMFFSFDSPYKEKFEEIRVGANYEETLENIKMVRKVRDEMKSDIPLTRVSMVLMKDNKDEYDLFVEMFKDIVDIVGYGDYINPQGMDTVDRRVGNRVRNREFACAQLWQRMFVAWDGEAIVCCQDTNRGYVVGNVREDKIKDIWQNEKYRHIREMHKNGRCDDIGICAKCGLPDMLEDGSY